MSGVVFTWTSSDPTVATIDANGLATGVATGTVQISASAQSVNSNAVSSGGYLRLHATARLRIPRLSPSMALAGSGDLIPLTITGTGFVTGALVNFGSNILTPSSVSPTAILVTVPAAELTSVHRPISLWRSPSRIQPPTPVLRIRCRSASPIMDLSRSILMTDISPCTTTGYRFSTLRD